MATSEEGQAEPVDSGRDMDRNYSSESGSSYFGGDNSFGFRSSLKPAAPAPKSTFSKPADNGGGGRLLFGGATPFASMPSYTPVTRASTPPDLDQFEPHMHEEQSEPAADAFAQHAADADFGDHDFTTEDPFSSSSPFESSPAYEPEPAPRSSFGLASSSQKPPASSYASPASSFSQPAAAQPASSFSQPAPSYEPAPASSGHAAGAAASYGYGGATDHAFDRYMAPAEAPAAPGNSAWKGAAETHGGAVQAFDAGYDQHPEIALGFGSAATRRHPQSRPHPQADAEDDDQGDADFLDTGSSGIASRSRAFLAQKSVLVAGALVGAVLLGGAIAYVYKGAGGEISGEPPIISADSRPVKVAPEESGGKDFPHKNKLIYDRLSGKEPAGDEKIVPHEEEVAAQNMPAADEQAAAAAPEDGDAEGSEAADQAQAPIEAVPEPEAEQVEASTGPRRVKTLTVRPDGTVVDQQPTMTASTGPRGAAANRGAAAPKAAPISDEEAAAFAPDQGQEASPESVAAIPPLPAGKPRAARAAQRQVAAAQPANDAGIVPVTAATPVGGSGQFVVQVAARKTQTEALAAFADMQQKYPSLLSGYRPMVQKADLGDKGTWYRLRVGPMGQRTAATKLCDQLRSAGLNGCLVMNE